MDKADESRPEERASRDERQSLRWAHDIATETDVQRGLAMTTTGDHVWDAGELPSHLLATLIDS